MTTPVAMDEAVIDNAVILSSWNEWDYAEADWTSFSIASDDFDKLNESLVLAVAVADADDAFQSTGAAFVSATQAVSYNSSPGSVTTSDSTLGEEDDLRLVHLLVAAAEALAGPHKSLELARVILVRLKVLASQGAAASGCGTSIERLAAYFTSALQDMLDGGGRGTLIRDGHRRSIDVITAFQLLQDIFPYVKFGHFTANQAILEATLGERRVHVVDYDIAEGVQWASFMQALVSRPGPPPPPHLRITAVSRDGSRALQETGRRLAEFAASVGQPFSFSQCRLDTDDCFRPAWVKVVKGEAVVMNCMLHPTMGEERRGSAAGVASFLAGAGTLGARAVVLVEEEDAGAEKESGFVGRFVGELRRYSAVWESLEAGFPMQERTRDVVERVILGPMIASAVGRAYLEARDGTREGGWGRWMAVTGFGRVGISCFNHSQAKLLLGLFSDGYRVAADGCNKLVLEWKASRLLSASVWSPPPPCVDAPFALSIAGIDVCFDDDSELFQD